jgi:hypothetical protein
MVNLEIKVYLVNMWYLAFLSIEERDKETLPKNNLTAKII